MDIKIGQRWLFNNDDSSVEKHFKSHFIVEIVNVERTSATYKIVQIIDMPPSWKIGYQYTSLGFPAPREQKWTYLEGQDKVEV